MNLRPALPWLLILVTLFVAVESFGRVTKTQDFNFHFWTPKGVCPSYYPQWYCDGYHPVDKLFNFTGDPFVFLLVFTTLFFLVLPMAMGRSFWEQAAALAFGFSYGILFSSAYPQGIGLFVILAYLRGHKKTALALSWFVHSWLLVLLVAAEILVQISNRAFPQPSRKMARAKIARSTRRGG
jgi:hypothetical protein